MLYVPGGIEGVVYGFLVFALMVKQLVKRFFRILFVALECYNSNITNRIFFFNGKRSFRSVFLLSTKK